MECCPQIFEAYQSSAGHVVVADAEISSFPIRSCSGRQELSAWLVGWKRLRSHHHRAVQSGGGGDHKWPLYTLGEGRKVVVWRPSQGREQTDGRSCDHTTSLYFCFLLSLLPECSFRLLWPAYQHIWDLLRPNPFSGMPPICTRPFEPSAAFWDGEGFHQGISEEFFDGRTAFSSPVNLLLFMTKPSYTMVCSTSDPLRSPDPADRKQRKVFAMPSCCPFMTWSPNCPAVYQFSIFTPGRMPWEREQACLISAFTKT